MICLKKFSLKICVFKKFLEVKRILGEIRKNNKGTLMKIIRYNGKSDVDIEFFR